METKNMIGFENVKNFLSNNKTKNGKLILLINTLMPTEQNILIHGTLPFEEEEDTINKIIEANECNKYVIYIYGKNYLDEIIVNRQKNLAELGFQVFIYLGGLFEWLLLQELYGITEFPTTQMATDIIKYRPLPKLI